jgi:hypothetical protein
MRNAKRETQTLTVNLWKSASLGSSLNRFDDNAITTALLNA